MGTKYVYNFGGGKADGSAKMKELLAALREEEARVAASKAAEAPAAGAGAGAGKGRAKAAAAATPAGEGAAASWSARLSKILQRVVGAGAAKKDG